MKTTSSEESCRIRGLPRAGPSLRLLAVTVLSLTSFVGCGPIEPSESQGLRQQSQEKRSENGLAYNGLAYNGLAYNGLAYNGLAYNGLAYNGLTTADFAAWFRQDQNMADHVMTYVVRCAMSAHQLLEYVDPTTNQLYTWTGSLGLAPGWANGQPASTREQQLITACLASHVNKHNQHVPFSVQGRDAETHEIPTGPTELAEYSQREACFFGNLFTGEGIYVGSDRGDFNPLESTSRACSLWSGPGGSQSSCPPMIHVGSCSQACTPEPGGGFYRECTRDGVSYMPLTTRLRPVDIFTCGDGVCQISESCGTGHQYNNCAVDCGYCASPDLGPGRGPGR
ncbi:MAG TPA: hypothetical protein VNA24_09370 [Hyalangium sp.]|nr:hypothetical protein [Hyalangium sp.]